MPSFNRLSFVRDMNWFDLTPIPGTEYNTTSSAPSLDDIEAIIKDGCRMSANDIVSVAGAITPERVRSIVERLVKAERVVKHIDGAGLVTFTHAEKK